MNVFDLEASLSLDVSAFKKALDEAKKSGTDFTAEMKKQAAQTQAMQKQIDGLSAELKEAQDEISKLRTELSNSAKAADDNADSTSDMTDEVNKSKKAMDDAADSAEDLGKEEGKTADKTDAYRGSAQKAKSESHLFSNALSALGDVASDTAGRIGDLAEKVGNALVGAAKLGIGAVTAASTAVAALTKSSVSAYGEYEQLVGGVDTLFKDSSGKVQEYAANAYKTAGLSANEYMETVTSFSASLLQSLSWDTEKSADIANMAIIDMSDNANKMGTDMSSIQNAYQGFAKQNYTMLDNLKLGYGGTAKEMARLLNESGVLGNNLINLDDTKGLNDAIAAAGGYAKIIEAIHAVQLEMGITGTTAEEAAGTITGSAASMRAAWQNLVTGFADPKADLGKLIDNFAESAKTSMGNMIPTIEQAISGIGDFIEIIAPMITEALPGIVEKTLPTLLSVGAKLVASIGSAIGKSIPVLYPMAVKLVKSLADGVINNAGTFISTISTMFRSGVDWLIANLPTIIETGVEIVKAIAQGIYDNKDVLIGSLKDLLQLLWTSLSDLGQLLWDNVIVPAWDWLIHKLPDYINTALKSIDFFKLGSTFSTLVIEGLKGIADFVKTIDWNQVGKDLAEFVNGIDWLGVLKAAFEAIGAILAATPDLFFGVIDNLDFEAAAVLVAGLFVPKILSSMATSFLAPGAFAGVEGAFVAQFTPLGALLGGILAVAIVEKIVNEIQGESLKEKLLRTEREYLAVPKAPGLSDDPYEAEKQIKEMGLSTSDVIASAVSNAEKKNSNLMKSVFNTFSSNGTSGTNTAADMMNTLKQANEQQQSWEYLQSINNSVGKKHAAGGIFRKETHIFGEDGDEAVIPLEHDERGIRQIADAISSNMVRTSPTINLTVNVTESVDNIDDIGGVIIEKIDEAMKVYSIQQTRATGGTGW